MEQPEPSAPENIQVTLMGFSDSGQANYCGECIAATVRAISRYINLTRLDGITVAYDYPKALAELDRGYKAKRLLTRSADERIVGVAMAPAVLRNGVVKAHLVFEASAIMPVLDQDHQDFRQAMYIIAHECAHVEELHWRDDRFPGTILQAEISDPELVLLEPISESLWSEYAACRLSAIFGGGQAVQYEECLMGALDAAREEANQAICDYRFHFDISRVLLEAGRPLCEPLRMAAYLVGHLDGRGDGWEAAPAARDRVAASEYATLIERMTAALRQIWSNIDSWESEAVFDPLRDIAREVLAQGGLMLSWLPDGKLYVDIPFTDATTPD